MSYTLIDPLFARPISAKRFSYNHLTPDERAQAGAEIYDHQYPIANLTMKQVEAIVGATAADINRHRGARRPKRPSHREGIAGGPRQCGCRARCGFRLHGIL
jgi:hypothetical protein